MKVRPPQKNSVAAKTTVHTNAPWYLQKNIHAPIISGLAVAAFGISVMNLYALDDFILIVKNIYTQKGLGGIAALLSKDTFAGMSEGNIMVLAGGRYRPLSVITFAIEHQLLGGNPHVSHMINVILYACCCVALLFVLRNVIFPNNHLTAFCIAAIWTIHPLHTEDVANIKGRDDIMCFLFFLLSIIALHKYIVSNKPIQYYCSVIFFFLSLLSKEFGLALFALLPLTCIMFISHAKSKKIITYLPHLLALIVFLFMRYNATADNGGTPSNDVFNNPWYALSFSDKYGTIFSTWLLYLRNLILPTGMSYDYNFNHIHTTGILQLTPLLSITIHFSMAVYAVVAFRRHPIISYGILFYFISFILVSNLLFNIGATMADRFMFIPSAGLLIAAGGIYLFLKNKFAGNMDSLRPLLLSLIALCVVTGSVYSAIRCMDWKDNNTLFKSDVRHVPQSVKANLNAGIAFLDTSDIATKKQNLEWAKYYLQRGIALKPDFLDGYVNMGVIYNWQQNNDSALWWWLKAHEINPGSTTVNQYLTMLATPIINKGLQAGAAKDFEASIKYFEQAVKIDPANAEVYYNLGGAYYSIGNLTKAIESWKYCLALNPSHAEATNGLAAAQKQMAGQ